MEVAAADLPSGVTFAQDSYDAVRGADALVIATEWNEFRMLDLTRVKRAMRQPVVIDTRNIYDPATMAKAGFRTPASGAGVTSAAGGEGSTAAAVRAGMARPLGRQVRSGARRRQARGRAGNGETA